MGQEHRDKITKLRHLMSEYKVDYMIIPSSDYHNSEYSGEYFKMREYLSGFRGSSGTLIVGNNDAYLWTDGRYFVQAEKELEGSGIDLCRIGEEGVPTIEEFLEDNIKSKMVLGYDGRVVTGKQGEVWERICQSKGATIYCEKDIAGIAWIDRPHISQERVRLYDEGIYGEKADVKLNKIRNILLSKGADSHILSKLDDIMWLFNIRGGDVACNPVALSYAYISKEDAIIFLQNDTYGEPVIEYFNKYDVKVADYSSIMDYVDKIVENNEKVLIDSDNTCYMIVRKIKGGGNLIESSNPTIELKSKKNAIEINNIDRVYLEDSKVVCKFMYWLKNNIGKIYIDEITAAEYMDALRRELDGYIDLSFPTISAYKDNAAMQHYSATAKSCKILEPKGMHLIDSGGQYIGGTTDVTRTIVIGDISNQIKREYTAVAIGMLRLSDCIFLEGTTGRNLDIMARQPLWESKMDYKHGTGHGIGYMLNVHEGPQYISWQKRGDIEAPLKEGMLISNEPGSYVEGSHGIRIENIIRVVKDDKNEYGQFMRFHTLTLAPIDLDGIDRQYMNDTDIRLLNEYHDRVYRYIAPLLSEEERIWLREATRQLG